jgi:hypothetical protein
MEEIYDVFGKHVLWRGRIRNAILSDNYEEAVDIVKNGSEVKEMLSELINHQEVDIAAKLKDIYKKIEDAAIEVIKQAENGDKEIALQNLLTNSELDNYWNEFKQMFVSVI